MFGYSKWRAWTVIIVSVFGILFSVPNFIPTETFNRLPQGIKDVWHPAALGLDLKGGSSLLLELDDQSMIKERLTGVAENLRSILRTKRILYSNFNLEENVLTFRITNTDKIADAKNLISKEYPAEFNIQIAGNTVSLSYTDQMMKQMIAGAIDQSIDIVRRRIDDMGTREPSISRMGENRILIQLPGVDNPDEMKALLGKTAKMTFHLVNEGVSLTDAKMGKIPVDSQMISGEGGYMIIKRSAVVGGEQLQDARTIFQDGQPVVSFTFKTSGAKAFERATTENIGKRLAIVLDGNVISAPVINGPIGASGIITGNFTAESASDLALLLRSGALPAPLKIIEEKVVGASLGTDSIRSGVWSCIIGALIVFAFMIAVYGWFGMFANIALILNVALLLALLSIMNATLTLPGIAGIVLTIGMAVDSNVLIYSRMKEEKALGRSPRQIIDAGFGNSFSAILDGQVTTLVAALMLFFMGSGPIKGFSVTLTIGVITSLFTAEMVTKFIILIWYHIRKPKDIKIGFGK